MIELKTERRSHRPDQLPHYAQLARHHHAAKQRELLYVTPTMEVSPPSDLSGSRFAHLSWAALSPMIRATWGEVPGWESVVADRLLWWTEESEAGRPLPERGVVPPARGPGERLRRAVGLAVEVQRDRQQRAVEVDVSDPERLEELRLDVDQELRSRGDAPNVLAWLWSEATSGGSALSGFGRRTGVELRLSYYANPVR